MGTMHTVRKFSGTPGQPGITKQEADKYNNDPEYLKKDMKGKIDYILGQRPSNQPMSAANQKTYLGRSSLLGG